MFRVPPGPRLRDSLMSADENRAMFDAIARYYDRTNRLLSLLLDSSWRRQGVAWLDPRPGQTYLDVGVGTGDIALQIVRTCPASRVLGIDPSSGMLAIGGEKVACAGLSDRISLLAGDVLALPFDGASFDGAITSFCIRNVTDRIRALREILRVLRPGARLVIVELTEPRGWIMKPLFRLYSRSIMPLLTAIMSSVSAYRYLADSMADFPGPETFCHQLEEAGFIRLRSAQLTGGIVTLFAGEAPLAPPTAPGRRISLMG